MDRNVISSQVIDQPNVRITNLFHTVNPNGRRTIRSEYKQNMPLQDGGWLANTTTERVVEGHGKSFKIIIPEHRVA